MMNQLPVSILDTPVEGINLNDGALRDQLMDERPTLLVFLRHFG